jgi:D-methionine transport system ATP-binding protein
LGASTEDVGGKAYGQMLIGIPYDEMKIARVKNYLDEIGIYVEEIEKGEVR